ncbi:hypothetical protein [uncultured Fibrella sp.]|uniref:hypothetical protein n=1 Tax=uncultured Fibrella sp. TaxID=1284596 RepID=UPI0035CB011C
MRKSDTCSILLLTGMLFRLPVAQATDYFVSVSGNDQTGNGSNRKPYATLAKALAAIPADQNHTLYLGPGVFSVKKQLLVPSGINLVGAGYDQTQVRCENYFDIQTTAKKGADWQGVPVVDPQVTQTATLFFNGKNQRIQGIGFDGMGKKTVAPILIIYGENMVFDGIYAHDFGVCGWWLHEGKNVTLRHSKFKNNSFGNFNQDYGAVQFHRVDDLFIHDNLIDESDTHSYGIKMASKDQENMWSKKDQWQTKTVNNNINIYNNVINVGEVGSWGVPGQPDSKVPTFSIEFNSDIECRAKIHHNWINNGVSIVSWEKGQNTRYEIYNNIADFRKPDGTLNKYAYFVETNLDHFDIHHNLIISGYYPLSNWVEGRNTDSKIHHNVFYAAFGREDLAFFYYGAGFDGYQFQNNTVIDLYTTGKLFEVRTKKAGNSNSTFKNNIFYSANPRGDVLGDSSAVNGVIDTNLFYNISPRGERPVVANPKLTLTGPLDELTHYALQPDSPAIDAGIAVPGLTDGFSGVAPDLGALEYGQPPFAIGVQQYKGPRFDRAGVVYKPVKP